MVISVSIDTSSSLNQLQSTDLSSGRCVTKSTIFYLRRSSFSYIIYIYRVEDNDQVYCGRVHRCYTDACIHDYMAAPHVCHIYIYIYIHFYPFYLIASVHVCKCYQTIRHRRRDGTDTDVDARVFFNFYIILVAPRRV